MKKIITAVFIAALFQTSNAQIINNSIKISSVQAGYEVFNENSQKYNSYDDFLLYYSRNDASEVYKFNSKPDTETFFDNAEETGRGLYFNIDFKTKNKNLFHSVKLAYGTSNKYLNYMASRVTSNSNTDTLESLIVGYKLNYEVYKLGYNFGVKSKVFKNFISFNASANGEYVQLANFESSVSQFSILKIVNNRNNNNNNNTSVIEKVIVSNREIDRSTGGIYAGINLGTEIHVLKNVSITANFITNFLLFTTATETSYNTNARGNFGLKLYVGK